MFSGVRTRPDVTAPARPDRTTSRVRVEIVPLGGSGSGTKVTEAGEFAAFRIVPGKLQPLKEFLLV